MATFEDVHGPDVIALAMEAKGITPAKLAAQLKQELNAKQVTRLKVKGAIDAKEFQTPKGKPKAGVRIIAKSGSLAYDKDGQVFGDGDTVIQFQDINWAVRQNARKDAHKLLGHYPATKLEVGGKVTLLAPQPIKKNVKKPK